MVVVCKFGDVFQLLLLKILKGNFKVFFFVADLISGVFLQSATL